MKVISSSILLCACVSMVNCVFFGGDLDAALIEKWGGVAKPTADPNAVKNWQTLEDLGARMNPTAETVMKKHMVTSAQLEQCDLAIEEHVKIYKASTSPRKQVEAMRGNCKLCFCLESTRQSMAPFNDGFGGFDPVTRIQTWHVPMLPVLHCDGCNHSDQEHVDGEIRELRKNGGLPYFDENGALQIEDLEATLLQLLRAAKLNGAEKPNVMLADNTSVAISLKDKCKNELLNCDFNTKCDLELLANGARHHEEGECLLTCNKYKDGFGLSAKTTWKVEEDCGYEFKTKCEAGELEDGADQKNPKDSKCWFDCTKSTSLFGGEATWRFGQICS